MRGKIPKIGVIRLIFTTFTSRAFFMHRCEACRCRRNFCVSIFNEGEITRCNSRNDGLDPELRGKLKGDGHPLVRALSYIFRGSVCATSYSCATHLSTSVIVSCEHSLVSFLGVGAKDGRICPLF